MKNYSDSVKEIHKIREQLFLETKDLTPEQRHKVLSKEVNDIAKHYGIKLINRAA